MLKYPIDFPELYQNYIITTEKTKLSYPVSLTEAKRHLRVEDSFVEDDDLIEDIIIDATEIIEDMIQKDIAKTRNVSQVWEYSGEYVRIPEANYHSIESIVTDASASVDVERVYPFYDDFIIEMKTTENSDPLTVTSITGFPFEENLIPKTLKRAILVKIGDLYDIERQGYNVGNIKNNGAIERLIAKYKTTQ